MKPTIAFYLSDGYFTDDRPTFVDDYYRLAYTQLLQEILHDDADVIIAREADKNYLADNQFRNYWLVKNSAAALQFESLTRPREFNLLYDKGHFPFDIARKVNSNRLRAICDDKYLSYLLTSDFHASSWLLRNENDLAVFRQGQIDRRIALKALDSHGGDEVFVGNLADYSGDLAFSLLAQSFVDTSGGAPGLTELVHDVRIRLFNGQPIGGSIRSPRVDGELRSNCHLGGRVKGLFNHELPSELVQKTQEIDRRFHEPGARFFSADWGFDKTSQTWKLFEINKGPGLAHASQDGPAADEYLRLLAQNLVDSARKFMYQ
jgi:hypothetical protein